MNQEHPTSLPHVFYIHNLVHRNGYKKKAQWTITELGERHCFEGAAHMLYVYGFGSNHVCWGLHFENNKVRYLGKSAEHLPEPSRHLFVAKFVDGNKNDKWHGYPADPENNNQDIPSSDILEYWMNSGYLKPAKVRKLAGGQRCKL